MSELKEFAGTEAGQIAGRVLEKSAGTAGLATEDSRAAKAPKGAVNDATEGSLASHLLFGVGTLLFALPMLLPGVSMGTLAVVYGSIIAALTLALVVWSIVVRLMDRKTRK